MEKKGMVMVYAIIAVIFLIVFILGFFGIYSKLKGGLTKEKLECEILDFIPFICSDASMQQLQQQQQQIVNQQQQQYVAVQNDLFNHVFDLYENCGKNSPKQKCVCEFDSILLEADRRLSTYFSVLPNNKIRISVGGDFHKEISGFLYVDKIQKDRSTVPSTGKEHTLVDINTYGATQIMFGYETRREYFGITTVDHFIVKIGNNIISDTPDRLPGGTGIMGTNFGRGIGILKDGNNRGLYVPYSGPNEEVELC